jgi:hypothetical protein
MAHCKNVGGSTGSTGSTPGGDGGDDAPRRFTTIEKGKGKKVLAKKRKAGDHEAGIAMVVVAAAEAVEAGGRSGALRIGSDRTPAQRRAILQAE